MSDQWSLFISIDWNMNWIFHSCLSVHSIIFTNLKWTGSSLQWTSSSRQWTGSFANEKFTSKNIADEQIHSKNSDSWSWRTDWIFSLEMNRFFAMLWLKESSFSLKSRFISLDVSIHLLNALKMNQYKPPNWSRSSVSVSLCDTFTDVS